MSGPESRADEDEPGGGLPRNEAAVPRSDRQAERSGGRRGRCWALILAGGAGERLGRNRPKAFVSLDSRPLLWWSVETFACHPEITDVLAVVPAGFEVAFRDEILTPLRHCPDGPVRARVHAAIVGGARRQDSSRIGLHAIHRETTPAELEETIVLIHDAARPIVPPALISASAYALRQRGPCAGMPRAEGPIAVLPVTPVEDTLKAVAWPKGEPLLRPSDVQLKVDAGTLSTRCGQVSRTVPRKGLWRAQTPQGFFLQPILEAHRNAASASSHATDDVTLYEMHGWPVEAIPGSRLNLKVARPEDLVLLEAWVQSPAGRASVRSVT
ncbi:MAG: NTP transferase domain-containing protein [Candidatus Eisenbacteria bacterium]|nr:NTP transferase domain-containing protein [Candidatus Eisenbacteria bacterium]